MSVKLRQRRLRSGTSTIYLDIYHKGKRLKPEYLGMYLTEDRKKNQEIRPLAEAIRAKLELQFHAEAEGLASTTKKNVRVLDYAQSIYEQKTGQTKDTYRNAFAHLEDLAGANVTFEQLTPKMAEQFRNYLRDEAQLKPNTVATYFERFRSILKSAVKAGIISQSPASEVKIRKTEALPKYLTEQQLTALAATSIDNQVIRDAFFFSCYTGLRYGDIVSLTWNQIEQSGIEVVQRKTGAAIVVPLSETASRILQRRRDSSDTSSGLVFDIPEDRPLTKP